MRFMMLMIPKIEDTPEDWMPSAETVQEMMRYNESLQQAGVLLALDGLHSSADGARVAFAADGAATVTDGPFTEAKELIGGYWVIQVRSKEEAVEWARRCPGRECVIEVRQVQDPEDFPEEVRAIIAESPLGDFGNS
jgi:hypothetical protein